MTIVTSIAQNTSYRSISNIGAQYSEPCERVRANLELSSTPIFLLPPPFYIYPWQFVRGRGMSHALLVFEVLRSEQNPKSLFVALFSFFPILPPPGPPLIWSRLMSSRSKGCSHACHTSESAAYVHQKTPNASYLSLIYIFSFSFESELFSFLCSNPAIIT